MTRKIYTITLNYYDKLLKKYGYSPGSVGWGHKKGKQSLRFEILCQIGDINNSSILDVGCGFGDLFGYLKYKKSKVKYLGVDINSNLIEIGKKIYPKANLKVLDIGQTKSKQKFDWVFFSGISSKGCTYPYIKRMMTKMFSLCKKGIAMNFVGGVIDFKSKDLFYSDVGKIYSITSTLSNRVTIRHDYAPYEFTVYVYKNTKKTSNNIFKDFLESSNFIFDDSLWHPNYNK
jgi:SAM-dependent methyltransferase